MLFGHQDVCRMFHPSSGETLCHFFCAGSTPKILSGISLLTAYSGQTLIDDGRSFLKFLWDLLDSPSSLVWISQSNKGYQMLQKLGWTEDSGLGIQEQGRMEPVKTVLKKDRKGLGRSKEKARVTHFSSYVESSFSSEKEKEDWRRRQNAKTVSHFSNRVSIVSISGWS